MEHIRSIRLIYNEIAGIKNSILKCDDYKESESVTLVLYSVAELLWPNLFEDYLRYKHT